MRLALHFDQDLMNKGRRSFWDLLKNLFVEILRLPKPKISSQVFIGSLLLHHYSYEVSEIRSNGRTERFNKDRFKAMLELWLNPPKSLYCTFTDEARISALE